jgi:hypothetical protein
MENTEQYVTPEAKYAAQMDEQSGVHGAQAGMAPYPLYGVPGLGQETATGAVPFWKRPMFCYGVGALAGLGLGWAFFGWFKPKYMKRNVKRKKKGD